jgi:hypothetical protein
MPGRSPLFIFDSKSPDHISPTGSPLSLLLIALGIELFSFLEIIFHDWQLFCGQKK